MLHGGDAAFELLADVDEADLLVRGVLGETGPRGGAMRFVALISLTLPRLQRIDQIEIANAALEEIGEDAPAE